MNEQQIIMEYENANEDGKKLLLRIFDEGIFVKKFVKKPIWIQLWEKFCKENNLNVVLPNTYPKSAEEEYDNASVMLRYIVGIKRGSWAPNWNDEKQYKYFPRFDMRDTMGGSSFGFAAAYYGAWAATSGAGSRLCYPTETLCIETVMEFLPIYEKYMK